MANETAIVKASDYELDDASASDINASFHPMIIERDLLAEEFKALIATGTRDEKGCRLAGNLRRRFVKARTGIAAIHKTQKHMFLMAGKFVDAIKNVQTLPITQMEEKLLEIEKHFENIELDKIRKIRNSRIAELRKYGVLDEQFPANLGVMEDTVWENYLAGVHGAYDLREEAEAKAEEERIAKEKADAEERERVRLENEQLKKEAEAARKKEEAAEAKRKAEAEERERADKARIAKEKVEAEKREAVEQERLAKEAKARKEIEDAMRKARAEQESLEQERRDRMDADIREQEEKKIREADKKHRKAVNKEIADLMVLIDASLSFVICDKIVKAIANGEFPNVSVNY